MAEQGHFDYKPDCAVFADTRWEPSSVYENLEWLESQVSFPIIRTDNGRSLRDDVLDGINAQGQAWLTLPAYLANQDGEPAGINWRQCTKNYKLAPIHRAVQEKLGVRPRQVLSSDTQIEMWLGITTDESLRVKPSRNWWIKHRYPLIDDSPMTRTDCLEWFAGKYPDRQIGRSACIGCPFRSSESWLQVKESEPELFADAVHIDAMLRSPEHNARRMFRKLPYLHHRRIPLAEAVEMDSQEREVNGFINECEGHCGL